MQTSPYAKELSPSAQVAHRWFRQLARGLKVMRLYRSSDNDVVRNTCGQITASLNELLEMHGALDFKFSPNEIRLEDEIVVKVQKRAADSVLVPAPEEQLPFMFYRDGVRRILIRPEIPDDEVRALLDALKLAGGAHTPEDDVVTLLWQSNMQYVQLETAPLEQTIYLSSSRGGGEGGPGTKGQAFAWAPAGDEIRSELGQLAGPQGLHRDTFDDWELAGDDVDVPSAYAALVPSMQAARAQFKIDWVQEWVGDWTIEAPRVLRLLLELDPGTQTRRSLSHFVVTWLAGAIQALNWTEAQSALELLREIDPDLEMSQEELGMVLSALDSEVLAEQLDERDADEQARFLAMAVAIGKPALELACAIMARAQRGRLRAAACTALSYLCGDEPELLAPYLTDLRWYVVRNVAFILGQIGGSRVVPLLRTAAHHGDVRVRRQVVRALGSVSREERMPVLLGMLDTPNAQLLSAALNMLTRDPTPSVARHILQRITAPDFESRDDPSQRALYHALSEVADDSSVDDLGELLTSGGWFARLTTQRLGAARTLRHIGSEKANQVLEAGLRSRSEAVRAACLDAMSARSAL